MEKVKTQFDCPFCEDRGYVETPLFGPQTCLVCKGGQAFKDEEPSNN